MSVINGRAKKYDGTAIDYIAIYNWDDGQSIAQVVPDITGAWEYEYNKSLKAGILYVADGCQPKTHGPYDFVSTDAVISEIRTLFTPTQTGVIYAPWDTTSLFKDDAGTQQVTQDGDIVRLMKDLSGDDNHAKIGAPLITSEGTSIVSGMRYRTDGTLHWLEPHNVDSGFIANPVIKSSSFSSFFALKYNDLNDAECQYFQQGLFSPRLVFAATRNADNEQMYAVFNNTYRKIGGALDTNPHIYSNVYDGSIDALTMQADNLTQSILSMPNSKPNKQVDLFFRIKAFNGRFYGAIIVDNLVATTENRDNIKMFLAEKSGITI